MNASEKEWEVGRFKLSGKAPTLVLVLKLAVDVHREQGLRSPAKVLSHTTFSFYVTSCSFTIST